MTTCTCRKGAVCPSCLSVYTLLPLKHDRQYVQGGTEPMQYQVLSAFAAMRRDPKQGQKMKPLREHQVHVRGLEDCWVWKIPSVDYDAELRIVYKFDEEAKTIEVVAIGKRQGSEVYREAMRRLDTRPEPPRWARFARGRRQRT